MLIDYIILKDGVCPCRNSNFVIIEGFDNVRWYEISLRPHQYPFKYISMSDGLKSNILGFKPSLTWVYDGNNFQNKWACFLKFWIVGVKIWMIWKYEQEYIKIHPSIAY